MYISGPCLGQLPTARFCRKLDSYGTGFGKKMVLVGSKPVWQPIIFLAQPFPRTPRALLNTSRVIKAVLVESGDTSSVMRIVYLCLMSHPVFINHKFTNPYF